MAFYVYAYISDCPVIGSDSCTICEVVSWKWSEVGGVAATVGVLVKRSFEIYSHSTGSIFFKFIIRYGGAWIEGEC